MDGRNFDDLTKWFGASMNRRAAVKSLVGIGGGAIVFGRLSAMGEAARRGFRGPRLQMPPTCVPHCDGNTCADDGCGGICGTICGMACCSSTVCTRDQQCCDSNVLDRHGDCCESGVVDSNGLCCYSRVTDTDGVCCDTGVLDYTGACCESGNVDEQGRCVF